MGAAVEVCWVDTQQIRVLRGAVSRRTRWCKAKTSYLSNLLLLTSLPTCHVLKLVVFPTGLELASRADALICFQNPNILLSLFLFKMSSVKIVGCGASPSGRTPGGSRLWGLRLIFPTLILGIEVVLVRERLFSLLIFIVATS